MATIKPQRNPASLKTRSVVCQALLLIVLLITGLLAAVSLYTAIVEVQTGISAHLIVLPVYSLIVALAILPAAVALTFWVWRAHANLHADRLENLKFSPGWAAFSLWVPFANLYLPKGAMRQLWNHSHGEAPWFADQSVDSINAWWTSYVVGIVIVTLLAAMMVLDQISNLMFLTPPGTNMAVFGFANLLLAGSSWFLLRIVSAITQVQQGEMHLDETFG